MLLLDKLQQIGFPRKTAIIYGYLVYNGEIKESDLRNTSFIFKESLKEKKKRLKELEKRGYTRFIKRDEETIYLPMDSQELVNNLEKDIKKIDKAIIRLDQYQSEDNLAKALRYYQLTEKAIQTYLELLKNNNSISKAVRKLKTKESSIYYQIKQLQERGLVIIRKGANKAYKTKIKILSPAELIKNLQSKKAGLLDIKKFLIDKFNDGQEAKEIYGEGVPQIKTYVGVEQIKKLFDEMLAWDGEILSIDPKEGTQKFIPRWNGEFIPKFNKRGKEIRYIEYCDKLYEAGEELVLDFCPVFKGRFLPEKFSPQQETALYNGNVVYLSFAVINGYKVPCATKTNHRSLYNTLRADFEFKWDLALTLKTSTRTRHDHCSLDKRLISTSKQF